MLTWIVFGWCRSTDDFDRWVLVLYLYPHLLCIAYLNHEIPLKRRKIFLRWLFNLLWGLLSLCPSLFVSMLFLTLSAERSHLRRCFFFVSIKDGLSIPLWNFGNVIQSQREPTSGGFDEYAGTLVRRSCDFSMVVSGGGSLPLNQISGDHAPRPPPLALMRDESSIIHG